MFDSDSGGKVPAAMVPVHGPDRVGRLLVGLARKAFFALGVEPAFINGSPGFLIFDTAGVVQTVALDVGDDRIVAIYVTRNPDKLRRSIGPARLTSVHDRCLLRRARRLSRWVVGLVGLPEWSRGGQRRPARTGAARIRIGIHRAARRAAHRYRAHAASGPDAGIAVVGERSLVIVFHRQRVGLSPVGTMHRSSIGDR